MQFYINNTAEIPLAFGLFAVAAVFTISIYRRHQLRSPWRYWLPTLRLAALALLIAALLQPVFVRTSETTERGNIAVIVDNSGSMSISDEYSLPRQVEISAALQLFPQDLRDDGFGKSKVEMRRLVSEFRLLEKRLAGVEQDIRRKNNNRRQRRINDVAVLFESGVTRINEIHDRVVSSIEQYPYLRADRGRRADKPGNQAKAQRGLFYKRWERIEGWDVESLLKSLKFKRDPDRCEIIPNFEAPRNCGTDMGVVVQGYVHPPRTGSYQFQFCSDDQGILYLSTNENPANKREICRCRTWAAYKKFDVFPEQISKPIKLEAGKSYYVEAYMKEHVGEDHLITGWRMPNGEVECPIAGEHLTPFGIIEAGYGGPTFQSLFTEISESLSELRKLVLAMDTEFDRAVQIDDLRGQITAIIALRKRVVETTKKMDDAWFRLGKLQNAADVALARSDIEEVAAGIKRLNAMKRIDLVKQLLTREPFNLQSKLTEKGIPRIYGLGDELRELSSAQLLSLKADLPRTDLGQSLGLLLKSFENKLLAGIILFSDGNNNVRQNLREMREIAREREIPVVAVGIGSERPPRDIAIDSIVAPSTSFRGDKTQLSVVLKRDGFNNQPVSLKIYSDQEMIHQKIVPPGPESRLTVDMSFVEQRSGVLEYELRAQKFDDEEVRRNNVAQFKINILKDPIRVLLVDETPRWETRYCRMMLQRDRRFSLNTVFVQSMGKDRDSSKAWFPSTGDLSTYQIVILGDVDPKHFSVQQLEDLRSFVVDGGGALILLAGPDFMPGAYMKSPLADVIPLSLLGTTPAESPNAPSKKKRRRKKKSTKTKPTKDPAVHSIAIKTTAEGKYDPVIQIADTPELSARLWEHLPPLDWVHTGVIPSRTADTLVVTREGNVPVVLRANIGLGRVLYLGSDSFWRWRYRAKWTYHHRLWGQLLLWGTIGRTTGSDRFVKFMTSRSDYTPDETVEITARILNESSLPLKNAHATVTIFDYKTGKVVRFAELDYIKDSGGKYIAHISGLPRGKYRATPVVQELPNRNASKAEAVFEIRDLPTSEYVDLALNPAGLKSFATQYVPYDQSNHILKMIDKLEVPRATRDEWEVWDSFYMVIAATILLGLEWFFRKRNQLV